MAYYDRCKLKRKLECEDNFIELKKYITSEDERGKWFLAHEYIINMEQELEKQSAQIEKYKEFFSLMRELLPRQY